MAISVALHPVNPILGIVVGGIVYIITALAFWRSVLLMIMLLGVIAVLLIWPTQVLEVCALLFSSVGLLAVCCIGMVLIVGPPMYLIGNAMFWLMSKLLGAPPTHFDDEGNAVP